MKRIIALILALATVFALIGCGEKAPEKGESEKKDDIISVPEKQETDKKEEEPIVPADTVISLIALGDNIVHTPIYSQAKKAGTDGKLDFSAIYENITDYVKAKDVAYINVETLIGGDKYGFSSYPNFNSPEDMGTFLVDGLGCDVMNLAHNHMLDAPGSDKALYLRNCANFFEEKGVTPIGYYKSEEDTQNIKVTEVKGVKIAWLSYTYDDHIAYDQNGNGKVTEADTEISDKFTNKQSSLNGHRVGSSPDTYIPFMKKELIEKQVKIAKEIADVVIVSAHWGVEDAYNPTNGYFPPWADQKYYGQYFADLGVDVIIGMHPHVIQPTEWLEGKDGNKCLCAYGLGNLISGMLWGRNMVGAMFEFEIFKDGASGEISIREPYMIPTVTQYYAGTKNFKIIPFSMYSEELASKHGCKAKDNTIASRGKKFSYAAIKEKIDRTYSEEMLHEGYGFGKPAA